MSNAPYVATKPFLEDGVSYARGDVFAAARTETRLRELITQGLIAPQTADETPDDE